MYDTETNYWETGLSILHDNDITVIDTDDHKILIIKMRFFQNFELQNGVSEIVKCWLLYIIICNLKIKRDLVATTSVDADWRYQIKFV
jgi:hypothetical protein